MLFYLAHSQAEALVLADTAQYAGDEWPGRSPRKVRIVEKQNEDCQPDGNGQRLVIHKLDGRKFVWPDQWTAKRSIEEPIPA